jgi:CubicO group peptidase (beta-lactamase class C family)
LLVTAVAGLAQDTARMQTLAKAQAAGDKFMGSVLVTKNDEVLFEQSYGFANLEWNVRHTPASKFRLGSITKQFTAAAILLLEERGQLKTDDPVSKYLPDTPAAWEKVTIHHLLTHTSGIPSFTSFPDYNTWKLSANDAAKTVNHFRDRPLEFQPGEKFAYSNSGYVLLGYVIERVSGKSYATFVRENLLQSLGMSDSGYDSNAEILPQRVSGYESGPNGLRNASFIDMHVPHAAGALYSTPRDLLRWTQGLFGGKLLSPAALAKMITPNKSDYACGLFVHSVGGRKLIEHSGGIDGFNTHLAYYPAEKITIVVLSNVAGRAPSELSHQLAGVMFGEDVKLPRERHEIELPLATLQNYVGVYQLNPRITNTIRLVDGRLTTQLSGQRPLPIFAESETKFFLKVVDAQVEFFKDDAGRVTHLVQYQNGREQKAPRISDPVLKRETIEVPRAPHPSGADVKTTRKDS